MCGYRPEDRVNDNRIFLFYGLQANLVEALL